MGSRRHDPDRRDRIIDSALAIIAEHGVAGTTHRKVAQHADVPLGSMTYHFADMDELLREALTRYANRIALRYAQRMRSVRNADDLVSAIADLVHHQLVEAPEDVVLTLELYTLAARKPDFRKITHDWMQQSRESLQRHVDSATAYELDALIEGLFLHVALDQRPRPRAATERAVRRLLSLNETPETSEQMSEKTPQ